MAATKSIPNPFDRLTLDAGGDGQFTLAELAELGAAVFFLPGDTFLWALLTYAAPLGRLLGIGATDIGGVLSAFVSICVWLTAFIGLTIAYYYVRDLDRRATRTVQRVFTTVALRARIARAVLQQRWRTWRAARVPANRVDFPGDIELSAAQLAALRLHAELASGYTLSISEAARALGARTRATEDLLDGLNELGLLTRAFGGADGESAYTLSAAGKAFLIFRQLHNAAPSAARRR
jgi:DNA-binding MarR family transcriptional regulator